MQIKCDNPATPSITIAKFGRYRIEFSKNGYATVPDNVGRYCVRKYPAIKDMTKKPVAKKTVKTPVVKKAELEDK